MTNVFYDFDDIDIDTCDCMFPKFSYTAGICSMVHNFVGRGDI